ncbi:hypothetical protein LOK49_LG01G00239 [Camellia lanceoleosa]|uniref:Uncharacterized protein n=1 Tax=Camellia lanceoleosa TaxID=1840588 RepID=A0ACC0IYF9_9ERIC|nr:hypothetical protein LOK49_LG01G00239 [Camellia lanceoleosa]
MICSGCSPVVAVEVRICSGGVVDRIAAAWAVWCCGSLGSSWPVWVVGLVGGCARSLNQIRSSRPWSVALGVVEGDIGGMECGLGCWVLSVGGRWRGSWLGLGNVAACGCGLRVIKMIIICGDYVGVARLWECSSQWVKESD